MKNSFLIFSFILFSGACVVEVDVAAAQDEGVALRNPMLSLQAAQSCESGLICSPTDYCWPKGSIGCDSPSPSEDWRPTGWYTVPHRQENPYIVNCATTDVYTKLKSLAYDYLAFQRDRGYSMAVVTPYATYSISESWFEMTYSDGSHADLFFSGIIAPGQPLGPGGPSIDKPIGSTYQSNLAFFWPKTLTSIWLGPDASGYSATAELMGGESGPGAFCY